MYIERFEKNRNYSGCLNDKKCPIKIFHREYTTPLSQYLKLIWWSFMVWVTSRTPSNKLIHNPSFYVFFNLRLNRNAILTFTSFRIKIEEKRIASFYIVLHLSINRNRQINALRVNRKWPIKRGNSFIGLHTW